MRQFVASARVRSTVLASIAAMVVSLLAAETRAQEAVSAHPDTPLSVGLLLGVGTALGEDVNPWGFGFGVRAGYSLGPWFLGGRFVYHIGTSEALLRAGRSRVDADYRMWELGAEAGYDVAATQRLVLRPSAVLGIANFTTSVDAPAVGGAVSSGTDTKLLLSLGASALYDIAPMIFVGADLRFPIAFGGNSVIGLLFYATGGLHF